MGRAADAGGRATSAARCSTRCASGCSSGTTSATCWRASSESSTSDTKGQTSTSEAHEAVARSRSLRMSKVVGIDLGTTNSLVAYVKDGVPVVIRDGAATRSCRRSCRSASDGTIFVGREAQRRLLTDAARTVYSVKRFMGRGVEDVQRRGAAVAVPRSAARPGGVVRIGLGEREFTPPEISAFILRELKRRAEEHFARAGRVRPRGRSRRHHRAGVLQRRAADRDARRRPDRRPRGAAHHQRADRGVARLRPRQAARRRRSRSTTSAAARSTSRSSASRTASSRCWRPTATRTSAATTSICC